MLHNNMELTKYVAVILFITLSEITATTDRNVEKATESNKQNFNPLESEVLDQNEGAQPTKNAPARVKRQYYPDPYYGRGPYYPIPIPIFLGGGFGVGPGFGRGFGGRGFGGRGFGGRGIGGRGIGGRGIGGRGIGGRGGIGGGGRGGGRG